MPKHHTNEIGNGFNRPMYDWLTKLQQWPLPNVPEPDWGNAPDVGKWMQMVEHQRALHIVIATERQRALIASVPRLNYVRAYNDAQRVVRLEGLAQAIKRGQLLTPTTFNMNEEWAGIEEMAGWYRDV